MANLLSAKSQPERLALLRQELNAARVGSQKLAASMAAGNISGANITGVVASTGRLIPQLDWAIGNTAFRDYARVRLSLPALDLDAVLTPIRTATVAVSDWIISNIPISAAGYLEMQTIVNRQISWRTFSPAQTAALQTLLLALEATIPLSA